LVFLISYGNLYSGEPVVIITVDGLSFVNTLFPGTNIEESNHYLKTALENMNISLPDTTIMDFTWSRNSNDTIKTVEELREFLKAKYQQAQKENKKLIVVAHSWGTVLTFLALSSQSMQVPVNERIYIDLYITLGSPLGTDNAHKGFNYPEETVVINYTTNWVSQYDFCDTCLPLVEKWVNYWAWGDVISGPLQGFMPFNGYPQWMDIQIDSSSYVPGYSGRNTATTVIWHFYDSMQPGGIVDNQPLLDDVKSQIEGTSPIVDKPPFGSFDTPVDGSTVRSSIAVTGWALDDGGVENVKIYRGPGDNLVYIGDVVFVEGARPDVETAYPGYPNHSKAGWGYMMLTNFLPNGGNGTFTIHAIATDIAGNQVTLGTKTIYCDNANAVKPFGAIDTPTQGGTASGASFINWGWALTPQPNYIPTDGSTINVYVDGMNLGHPIYNIYREDLATLFPGYANKNGAAGYFYLDTTAYENGLHTIQWTATDNAGNTDGIGSRYFTIQNTGSGSDEPLSSNHQWSVENKELTGIPVDDSYNEPIRFKTGYNKNIQPQTVYPDDKGIINIEIKELERVEIDFEGATSLSDTIGYQLVGNQLKKLPIGSFLDEGQGIFYWTPGPGFVGVYELVFMDKSKHFIQKVKIKILPKYSLKPDREM